MIRFPQFLLLSLFSIILFSASFATGDSSSISTKDSLSERYQQAKFYYNQLETKGTLGQSRENWLKGTRNFRRIYLSSPKNKLAPACLFMLGKMYFRMYKKFNTGIDLGEALSYYRDTYNLFPEHRLADDALFAIGNILIDEIHDPKRAAASYSKIVSDYPSGDMHPQAANKLKGLSKDYDIPLPKVMVGSSSLKDLNYVLPVKYWSSKNYTRVVIKASGPVTYREQLLEKNGDQPRRLYIDFKDSYIEPKFRAPVPIQDGLLKQIRTGQFSKDTVRVVLDIETISDFKIFSLPDPFRVVIDVRGKEIAKDFTKSVSNATPIDPKHIPQLVQTTVIVLQDNKKILKNQPKPKRDKRIVTAKVKQPIVGPISEPPSTPLSLAQQLGLGVKKIVIDPGHGGKDPGAMAYGLKEKDIVLKIAKNLAAVLAEETGAETFLTRDSDKFIPLEERTAVANASGADLFVSLHVNAHPSADVRGLETYYLNLSTNAEAMRVAARENATSTHQMSDLQDILSDIMKNSKINESSRLAQQVHNSILDGLVDEKFGKTKNLGVKQAPFYVLIGAEMPAILIEIGFISNPEEAKFLQDDHYLNIVTEEIAEGIKLYINNTSAGI